MSLGIFKSSRYLLQPSLRKAIESVTLDKTLYLSFLIFHFPFFCRGKFWKFKAKMSSYTEMSVNFLTKIVLEKSQSRTRAFYSGSGSYEKRPGSYRLRLRLRLCSPVYLGFKLLSKSNQKPNFYHSKRNNLPSPPSKLNP